ncbi:MAG: substrate-binding domain-containing protein [Clostridiaceae bacterium]
MKTLYALSESAYTTSAWYLKSLSGLQDAAARQRIGVTLVKGASELDALEELRTLVLIGSDSEWAGALVASMRKRGVKVVLMGSSPNDFGADVSGALFNRETLVHDMVRYLRSSGRTHLATLGHESNLVNDNIRRHAFLSSARQYGLDVDERRDVYGITDDLAQCLLRFFENLSRYDGVICTNDYVAAELLVEARARGISVPERLFVCGSGNLMIGLCTTPTLTTSTLDYYELGVQTMNIWNLLENNAGIVSVSVTIPCKIIPRESTACLNVPKDLPGAPHFASVAPAAPSDPTGLWLRKLEACLLNSDALDRLLLSGVLRGMSTEKLAAQLFVSPGTVQYRLRKLYAAVNAPSRGEFVRMLSPYVAVTALEVLKNEDMFPWNQQ